VHDNSRLRKMRRFSAGKKAYLRNTYLRCIYIGVVYSIVAGKKTQGKSHKCCTYFGSLGDKKTNGIVLRRM